MKLSKEFREIVHAKCNGHCAYCGSVLPYSDMQVDHIVPVRRGTIGESVRVKKLSFLENLNPSCGRCNRYKSTMNLENFRKEISQQVERARRDSWNFRMAEDFGLIEVTGIKVEFYFEKMSKNVKKSDSQGPKNRRLRNKRTYPGKKNK